MKKHLIIVPLFLLGLCISSSSAVEVTLYGPKQFTREEGKPNVYTDTFPGRIGEGILVIKNNRVSSAIIRINGVQVLGTKDFNQNIYDFEIPISLLDSNTISVELRSKPKSYLIIDIIQEIEAEAAAVVGTDGGIVEVTDSLSPYYGVRLEVPPGAINISSVISIQEPSFHPPIPDGFVAGDNPVELQPSGLIFNIPIKLIIPSNGLTERMYYLFNEIEFSWACLDTIHNSITENFEIETNHFSFVNALCFLNPLNECPTFGPGIISYSINSTTNHAPGYSTDQIEAAIVKAVQTWDQALFNEVDFIKVDTPNADIHFFWDDDPFYVFPARGWTYIGVRQDLTHQILIRFNDTGNILWSADNDDVGDANDGTGRFKYSIEDTALHEMGHALGLIHNCPNELTTCIACSDGPVMAPEASPFLPCVELQPNDIERIRSLYGLSGVIQLEIVSSLYLPGYAYDVYVSGNYAYALTTSSLQVIDITDPLNPIIIGSVPTPHRAFDLFVSGNYAYFTDDMLGGGGLNIVDISDPHNPSIISTLNTGDWEIGVYVKDSYAYVTKYPYKLIVVDISNPWNPIVVSSVNTSWGAWSVCVSGSYAYVGIAGSTFFNVVDIMNPLNPRIIGSLGGRGWGHDIEVSGSYAYVSYSYPPKLLVVDIVDPQNIRIVGSVEIFGSFSYGLDIVGSLAFIANHEDGLHLVNVSDPQNPIIVYSLDTPGHATSVYVHGIYAYVTDGFSGFHVIRIF
ncbi:MAG: matrixin family metalloprotease [Candidatus Hodarchaeota archaeon]